MSHTAGVDRKRIKLHDSTLCCDALRGVAWFARCACGWEDERPFRFRSDALAAAQAHRDDQRRCGL